MVWNSASSTLYRTVERHNSGMPSAAQEIRQPEPPKPEHEQPNHCRPAPPQEHTHPHSLGALTADRDTLLIAGLILLLMHEKADTKLILALAFVLLM